MSATLDRKRCAPGLAGKFFEKALIVMRSDAHINGGKRDFHTAFATFAVGVRASGFGGRRNFAVTDSNLLLIEVFDAESLAEGPSQFFKFQNFAGVGFFVDAMESLDGTMEQVMSHRAVGGEHELFDDAMSDVSLAARYVGHVLLVVEFDDRFGKIEIDGAIFVATGVEKKGETLHGAEMVIEMRVARGHLWIAFENFVDVGIGHALGRADDALNHPGIEHAASRIEMHDGALDEAFFARLERAHTIGKRFWKHGNGAIDEVDRIAAEAGFAIERRFWMNVVSDVGNVDLQEPATIFAAIDVNGVVEIAGGFAIDRDDGEIAKIFAAGAFGFRDGKGETLSFLQNSGEKV